jgi:membrane AbrB-like protein
MIARSITPAIVDMVLRDWPLFLIMILAVIFASNGFGWLLARARVVPGTTAVWGSAPGAATAMTLMAEAHGADVRLVAFMQYLRVVMVVVVASVISRLWMMPSAAGAVSVPWFPPVLWTPFAETLALAGLGAVLGRVLRVPAGPLLLPLIIGAVLHGTALMTIELPPWLLAASYGLVGWGIGLRFTRPILVHAARALPRLAAAILALIALCGGLAVALTWIAGIDPLTAYLATSPGGADSVAIIAGSTTVDMPFVMAMQTARFVVVLLIGPGLARFFARRTAAFSEKIG